jgi:AraC-like DNA-binding protein
MNDSVLGNILSGAETEVYMAFCNPVGPDWKDLDYCPDYSKLYYIVEGSGWIRIGEEDYYPQPGQLVLMPEGVSQSYSVIDGQEPYRKYWTHFGIRVGSLNLFKRLSLPYLCTVSDRSLVESTFAELVVHANSNALYSKVLAKAKLLELFSYYLMELREEQLVLKNLAALERLLPILKYVHDHMERDFTVNELASLASLHPNYFIRMFKEQIGVPPIQYIVRSKMDKAKELLLRTSLNVGEVAARVGFQDMSHFSKQFKKIAGVSPSEFRKQNQG